MHLIYSICIITASFSMSALTILLICYVNNKPVMNPTNHKGANMSTMMLQSICMMYIVSDNIIPRGQHDMIDSIVLISKMCLFIEANYYVYHRVIHKYYYVEVHKKHHENITVYPFDAFYLTEIDDFSLIFSLLFPTNFIKVSMIEQSVILYIYMTTSFISHSDLYWKHHYIHHKLPCYNYCLLFPIFDILFGTYKIE